ncbi:MAG: nucleotidyl transferase AbiEii/AbiGii toxin family protein [Bacteroidia bacterium]|nr:nucleotidyl transferase AbiEii/AbiGii toxin family protein [Bacteroidia bacterium]
MKRLMAFPAIDPFFLVGGTALALQMGHRLSVDLDLFTMDTFDKDKLIDSLLSEFEVTIESEGNSIIITNIQNIKVDFVKMGYPVLYPPLYIDGIRMLEIRDIAPMKLKAVTQRGSKKDFYDIYFLINQLPLEMMLQLFKEKFKQYEVFHIVKSLIYFEDAEQYADPIVFDKRVTWAKVKSDITDAVKNLL